MRYVTQTANVKNRSMELHCDNCTQHEWQDFYATQCLGVRIHCSNHILQLPYMHNTRNFNIVAGSGLISRLIEVKSENTFCMFYVASCRQKH